MKYRERAPVECGPKNNGLQGTGGSTEPIHELLTMVNSPTVAGALVAPLGARVGPSVPLTLQSPRLARPRRAAGRGAPTLASLGTADDGHVDPKP